MSKDLIFHEVYGSYYNVIAKILAEAAKEKLDQKRMREIILEHAFSESVLAIPDMLRSGKWPLIDEYYRTEIFFTPSMPLTIIQKRWLKAILADPRIRLFPGITEPEELKEVRPLFRQEDIVYYDRYADGDPFTDPAYIANFHTALQALEEGKALEIRYLNRRNQETSLYCLPDHLEYSSKDDKFRLHLRSAARRRQSVQQQLNMARIISCSLAEWTGEEAEAPGLVRETAVLELIDTENTLERAMLQFSYLEKETERIQEEDSPGPARYRISLHYDKSDETEVLIRILSFGPGIWVTGPEKLRSDIRDRLLRQKRLFSEK